MKKKLKNLIFILIYFLIIIAGRSFAFTPSTEQILSIRSGTLQNYTAPSLGSTFWSKQQIVDAFCKQSLSPNISKAFNDENDRYLAEQSIFLALLCSQTTLNLPNFHPTISPKEENSYLKKGTTLQKLKYEIECSNPEEKYKKTCKLGNLSEEIISDIISDLTTLKQANLYGVNNINFTNKKQLEKDISLWGEKYLNIGKSDDTQTNFCNGKKHSYPKTCHQAIKNIKAFEKPLQKLKIIDIQKLLNNTEEKYKNTNLCIKDMKKTETFDSLFCNIFGIHNKELGLKPFINQVYNELLRYFLFTSYYHYNLKLANEKELEIIKEKIALTTQPPSILNATNQTLKDLAEIQSTYSFHIGMLAYQEDLKRLRNTYLSKIIPPFYTLFYKLQNVQIPK